MNVSYNGKNVKGDILLTQNTTIKKPIIHIPEGHYVVLYDMDAPNPSFIHWIVNSKKEYLPYYPPSPPSGTHRYIFRLVKGAPSFSITNENRSGQNINELAPEFISETSFTQAAKLNTTIQHGARKKKKTKTRKVKKNK